MSDTVSLLAPTKSCAELRSDLKTVIRRRPESLDKSAACRFGISRFASELIAMMQNIDDRLDITSKEAKGWADKRKREGAQTTSSALEAVISRAGCDDVRSFGEAYGSASGREKSIMADQVWQLHRANDSWGFAADCSNQICDAVDDSEWLNVTGATSGY